MRGTKTSASKTRARMKRPRNFFEQLIVEGGRRHAKHKADHAPNELRHEVVRADLRHT